MAQKEEKKVGLVQEGLDKRMVFVIASWIVGVGFLLLFTLVFNIPILIAAPVLIALITKQWLLAIVLTFVRGSGIFGVVDVQMFWIVMTMMSCFVFGIYNFFFNTKKFLKIKRK